MFLKRDLWRWIPSEIFHLKGFYGQIAGFCLGGTVVKWFLFWKFAQKRAVCVMSLVEWLVLSCRLIFCGYAMRGMLTASKLSRIFFRMHVTSHKKKSPKIYETITENRTPGDWVPKIAKRSIKKYFPPNKRNLHTRCCLPSTAINIRSQRAGKSELFSWRWLLSAGVEISNRCRSSADNKFPLI